MREIWLEKSTWKQHLEVGGCGSFNSLSADLWGGGVPYAKLVPGAKSNMEGVLGQPSLAGAWVSQVTSSLWVLFLHL